MDNKNKENGYDVKGKVALITGAAGGIGAAISKAILEEGAKGISLCDFNEDDGNHQCNILAKCYGQEKVQFIKCNVLNDNEIKAAFERTVNFFGQLDIMVNNAGILNEMDVNRTVDTNLTAVIIGTQLAIENYLPKYKSDSEGVVLNTASILGLSTLSLLPTYSATKHGVVALGECYGDPEEYNRTKVRVMSLCPGLTSTAIVINPKCRPQHQPILDKLLKKAIKQGVEWVGDTAIHMIKYGKPGSAWVINNTKMEERKIDTPFNVGLCFTE